MSSVKSFAEVCSILVPKTNSQPKVGPGWKIFTHVKRDYARQTEPVYTEDELYEMRLEEEYEMAYDLEDVLYEIYLRRERESIEYFKTTGEYDTFALEKEKYNEYRDSEYYE